MKKNVENFDEKKQVAKNKSVRVASLRNRFFYIFYRYSILVFFVSLCSMVFSIFFFFSFVNKPLPPQYVPINIDGTYIKLDPLSECKSDGDVQSFLVSAIQKLYKYDYVNYADQLQAAGYFFTKQGWDDYLTSFSGSGTLVAVKTNRWVVTVAPVELPAITKNWKDNGVCMWETKQKISISYVASSGSPQVVVGDFYAKVQRESAINNPDGLAISQVVFIEDKK